ncbi:MULTISPECIES: DMT family transporter [unclassified Rhizobium]|uniref:DMT family transporter n=1 Tax=unclassified Rhizobium TaxID=2613769 RepID=UPI00381BCF31
MLRREVGGLAWLVLSGASFVAMSSLMKLPTLDLPTFEVVFFRSTVACLVYLLVLKECRTAIPRLLRSHRLIWRSLFGFASFGCYAACLANMRLSDVSGLFYTTPIWSFLLGLIVLKERPERLLVTALLLGFCGMLLVVRPSLQLATPWLLLAVLGAGLGSLATMSVRLLVVDERPAAIAAGFMAWSTIMAAPLAFTNWTWPSPPALTLLAAIGTFAAISQLSLTEGYRRARLVSGTAFDFVRLPMSVAVGIEAFGEQHGGTTFLGLALVAAGSLLSVLGASGGRERARE